MSKPTLVWFRLDLRLADNPALDAAIRRGGEIIPVYIWAPEEEEPWAPGAASRWWLHQSLASLTADLGAFGSRLILRGGPTLEKLLALLKETGADSVVWNRRYEPDVASRDLRVKSALTASGFAAQEFSGGLLHEPSTILNKSGKPFQVFTAFWKHCLALRESREPLGAPPGLRSPRQWPRSVPLAAFELEPRINWAARFSAVWQPGERGAMANLRRFLRSASSDYPSGRNLPAERGTSRLSPHLHFGEISPRQIRQARGGKEWTRSQFMAEIGWREFAHYLLSHFPRATDEPIRPAFRNFRWRKDEAFLRAWQRGRTGYPIVDAGMRELWATGWMHNRARMIVGSFLVKDLLIPWQEGARWFWDTLVDADLANNTIGWQWTAGCGADAAPYFRIFNPVSQGEKFDPDGAYVRRWCPALANVPSLWIHQPWNAPQPVDYPERIINHATARHIALEAFNAARRKETTGSRDATLLLPA